jgi:hypothetical protein
MIPSAGRFESVSIWGLPVPVADVDTDDKDENGDDHGGLAIFSGNHARGP